MSSTLSQQHIRNRIAAAIEPAARRVDLELRAAGRTLGLPLDELEARAIVQRVMDTLALTTTIDRMHVDQAVTAWGRDHLRKIGPRL